jgi:hypothetical protein
MELTIKFISDNFNVINELYFNNELKTPKFEINHLKKCLGQYHWKRNTYTGILLESVIRISDFYDRTEDDIVNTIAHEMIHLYIRQNNIRDTRPHHGRVFNQIADRLNREGGFHIARTDSVEGCGFRDKTKKREFYVGLFYCGRLRKYFSFVMNKNYVEYYKKVFNWYPHHYQQPIIFKSTDDKAWAHYPQCRRRVSGYTIDKDTYDYYKETEKEFVYQIKLEKVA